MMVSPVSFRATTASTNFNDLIRREQSYTAQPTAATSIDKGEKKKGGVGKKILGLAVAAAAIAGGLVLGHKKGIFAKEVNNELLKKGMGYLDKAGKAIAQYGQVAITKAGEGLTWLKGKAGELIAKIRPEQA